VLAGVVFVGYLGLGLAGISTGEIGNEIFLMLMYINIVWGILNLLPIYPLDGGQITGVLLSMANRRNGMRWTHTISLLASGVLAVLAYQFLQSVFLAVFFGSFALANFQILQQLHQYAKYGGSGFEEDDADWWKR
jgi:membrane-associated protease RseP (regulator of RpoE activity)